MRSSARRQSFNLRSGPHRWPPLDSRVEVTITSPTGVQRAGIWHANKIGWLYDPSFDFVADEAGRWTVDVYVEHDRPYIGNGVTPLIHNTGTVMGTTGQYSFYVVPPGSPELLIVSPRPGILLWPNGQLEPVKIHGFAPAGATSVFYTIHDKGIVMGQGTLPLGPDGAFTLEYDAEELHNIFSMLSLVAHEEHRPGLADNVMITFISEGGPTRAAAVNLIGEEVFVVSADLLRTYLPLVFRE